MNLGVIAPVTVITKIGNEGEGMTIKISNIASFAQMALNSDVMEASSSFVGSPFMSMAIGHEAGHGVGIDDARLPWYAPGGRWDVYGRRNAYGNIATDWMGTTGSAGSPFNNNDSYHCYSGPDVCGD